MSNQHHERRCDGETLFGFTVKSCDKPAVYFPCNTPHECYQFCARHFYFYEHGRYPEDETKQGERDDTADTATL